jgi:hypothetical protein
MPTISTFVKKTAGLLNNHTTSFISDFFDKSSIISVVITDKKYT